MSFSSAETAEQLAKAIQNRLDKSKFTVADVKAVELIAQLRGWILSKTPKASADSAEQPTVKPPDDEPNW